MTLGTSVILVLKISETLAKSAHKDSTVLLVLLCLLDALILFIGVALVQQTSPAGYYCVENDPIIRMCPSGHFCPN